MKTLVNFAILCSLLFSSAAFADTATEKSAVEIPTVLMKPDFEDGKDYFSYQEPIEQEKRADGKISLLWFWDYDCRTCSAAQDILEIYLQLHKDKLYFEEYPVALPKVQFSARTFLTLQAMGQGDISDNLLFETAEIQQYTRLSQFNGLLAWLETQGVDSQRFQQLYHSEQITSQVSQLIEITEKYGVFTYPFVVVGGKYVLTASTLYNDDYTVAVLDFLMKKLGEEK